MSISEAVLSFKEILDGTASARADLKSSIEGISLKDVSDAAKERIILADDLIMRLCNFTGSSSTFPDHQQLIEARRNLIETYDIGRKTLSVFDIHGVTATKSYTKTGLDALANSLKLPEEAPGIARIKFQSDEDFKRNSAYVEEALGSNPPYKVVLKAWSKKYYLVTPHGCSHHLAALYRQCKDQGREFSLLCDVEKYSVNKFHSYNIIDNFYALIINVIDDRELLIIFQKVNMRYYYSGVGMDHLLVCLPRNNKFSEIAYNTLVSTNKVFDLSKYLIKI